VHTGLTATLTTLAGVATSDPAAHKARHARVCRLRRRRSRPGKSWA